MCLCPLAVCVWVYVCVGKRWHMCWPAKGWPPTVWITGSISLLGTLGFSSFNNAALWMSEPQIVFTSHVSPCLSTSSPRCLTNSDFCRAGILFAGHWFLFNRKDFFLLRSHNEVSVFAYVSSGWFIKCRSSHLTRSHRSPQQRRQPALIFYWCSFKVCELLSGGHDSLLTSLHIQMGAPGREEGGAPQGRTVFRSVFTLHL